MRKIAIGLLLLTLTACGGAATPTTGSDSTGSTGASPSAMPSASTAAGGDAPVAGTPGNDMLLGTGEMEKTMMTMLSATISKPEETLKLQNKEAMEWSNGALGCPKEGMMYTEMIVSGYKLTYTDGTQTYDIHTDSTGQNAVLCDNGEPKTLGGS